MKAMVLEQIVSLDAVAQPLRMVDLPIPRPAANELLVRVSVCGVCHTELDEIEGRLVPPRLPIVLGHEVVGHVEDHGPEVTAFSVGDRVGVGWIHHSDGKLNENLSPQFAATGCDVNGGYAQYMTVGENYAAAIPESIADAEAAPLMCAGAIGYRALRLAAILDTQPLGLMGFGGSAHLVLQVAKHLYPQSPIFVFDRNKEVQRFAVGLGADWAGDVDQLPPQKLQAIIDTTPAWRPIVESMKKLAPGGRLVINAIRKENHDKEALLELSYHDHLWMEREIKSVANLTRRDIAEFLPLAAKIPLHPKVTLFPLEKANEALQNLRQGGIRGANVLTIQ
jgi:propanol-preferring alcohol dehydrogenase